MKIVCISDMHLQHLDKLPEGDILVDAGDMTFQGNIKEITQAADWRKQIKNSYGYREVICIAGNHDWLFQKDPTMARLIMRERGITYLEDAMVELDGLKIFGSPWQPEFGGWAFNLSRDTADLRDKWANIPDDVDVLITHGPPLGIGDRTKGWVDPRTGILRPPAAVGCYDLKERVAKLPKLKLHVFGHIHHSYGEYRWNGAIFANASVCNEKYRPVHKPLVFDIK